MSINRIVVHKSNGSTTSPKVSVVMGDWSCRESFHTLYWLSRQDVPREQYELIWVELYDRVVPQVMEMADVVITCGHKGFRQSQICLNVGLLHSRGQVITMPESDAVFPPDFISSVITAFNLHKSDEPDSLVLMHHEARTRALYPKGLSDLGEINNYSWTNPQPNVGACGSYRRRDAVGFGGFDEHFSLRGMWSSGPNDLGWRLVNAGIPEIWHDESVILWHFAHPDPFSNAGGRFPLRQLWRENAYPHVKHLGLTPVEAFSTGRLLPLKENPALHELRMSQRRIGTSYEEEFARMTGPTGFTKLERLKLRLALMRENYVRPFKEPIWRIYRATLYRNSATRWLTRKLGKPLVG